MKLTLPLCAAIALSLTLLRVVWGTTANLETIFLGRCFAYQELMKVYPQRFTDCPKLWKLFLNSFQYKNPCNMTRGDYQEFVDAAITTPTLDSKALFWSGTYRVAHQYGEAGQRFITLEDTLLGYILNGLTWCGKVEPPGIDYGACPPFDWCPPTANMAFWGTASAQFASMATGEVLVMLDGSNPASPAYRPNSYFSLYELPNLQKAVVTGVTVLVVHNIDSPYRESCNNGSVPLLQSAVQSRGFPYRCHDNPRDVIHLLCVDDPNNAVCRLANNLHGSKIKIESGI